MRLLLELLLRSMLGVMRLLLELSLRLGEVEVSAFVKRHKYMGSRAEGDIAGGFLWGCGRGKRARWGFQAQPEGRVGGKRAQGIAKSQRQCPFRSFADNLKCLGIAVVPSFYVIIFFWPHQQL